MLSLYTDEQLELEEIYQKYCVRLKHSLFLSCLVVALLGCLSIILLTLILREKQVILFADTKFLQTINNFLIKYDLEEQHFASTLWILSGNIIILITAIVCSLFPNFLEIPFAVLTSSLVVISAVSVAIVLLAGRNAAFCFFILIIAVHTMMPLRKTVTIVIGVLLATFDLMISFCHRYYGDDGRFSSQLFAQVRTTFYYLIFFGDLKRNSV